MSACRRFQTQCVCQNDRLRQIPPRGQIHLCFLTTDFANEMSRNASLSVLSVRHNMTQRRTETEVSSPIKLVPTLSLTVPHVRGPQAGSGEMRLLAPPLHSCFMFHVSSVEMEKPHAPSDEALQVVYWPVGPGPAPQSKLLTASSQLVWDLISFAPCEPCFSGLLPFLPRHPPPTGQIPLLRSFALAKSSTLHSVSTR